MSARFTSWLAPLAFRTLVRRRSPRAAASARADRPGVPQGAAVCRTGLRLSPLDSLPDFIPIIGQLDDLAIVIMGLKMFLRLAPSEALAFHRGQIAQRQPFSPMPPAGDVIDAEFHRL